MNLRRRELGFTLIELLAVIVILAVIAVIATPIIMNVIANSRMGTFKDTAYGILKAGEIKVTKDQTATNVYTGEVIDLTADTLHYKGTKPKAGFLVMEYDGKMALEMNNGEFCATKSYSSSEITVTKKGNNTCNGTGIVANFESEISLPEIKDGMIPITFDASGNTVKTDINSTWYDYENQKWANAVSVTSKSRSKYQNADAGTTIAESDILGYFVWIPRYKYLLWNAESGTSNEQEIQIEFEKMRTQKSNGTKNGEWLTHPAFTFGNSELSGIWVGKFETTGTEENPTIKPNQKSLNNQNIAAEFYTIRKLSTTDHYGLTSYDAHMMKNMEWGAVAYLSHSKYGKNSQVWINNVSTGTESAIDTSITGCAGESVSADARHNMTACESGRDYKNGGVNASTTGNITGIYDMSGGNWERTMGVLVDTSNNPIYASSGFDASTMPEAKYYDSYSLTVGDFDYVKGKLGDATKEVIKGAPGDETGWYSDYSSMPIANLPWFHHGGGADRGSHAGIFGFTRRIGGSGINYSARAVIVAN